MAIKLLILIAQLYYIINIYLCSTYTMQHDSKTMTFKINVYNLTFLLIEPCQDMIF